MFSHMDTVFGARAIQARGHLLMAKVAKFASGGRPRLLRDMGLRGFDSVRKVSILIDDIRRKKSRPTGAMAVAGEKQKSGSAGAGERINRINRFNGMGGQPRATPGYKFPRIL